MNIIIIILYVLKKKKKKRLCDLRSQGHTNYIKDCTYELMSAKFHPGNGIWFKWTPDNSGFLNSKWLRIYPICKPFGFACFSPEAWRDSWILNLQAHESIHFMLCVHFLTCFSIPLEPKPKSNVFCLVGCTHTESNSSHHCKGWEAAWA